MGSNCGRLLSIRLIAVATALPALDQVFESNGEEPPEIVLLLLLLVVVGIVVVIVVEDDEDEEDEEEAGVLEVEEVVFCSGFAAAAAVVVASMLLLLLDEDVVVVVVVDRSDTAIVASGYRKADNDSKFCSIVLKTLFLTGNVFNNAYSGLTVLWLLDSVTTLAIAATLD